MIFLSKNSVNDPGSNVVLRNYQVTGDYNSTARISRVKTLDGAGVLTPFGASVVDRDLAIKCRVTDAEAAALRSLHENTILVRISFWQGLFHGYIYRLTVRRDGAAELTFYFKGRLT